MQESVLRLGWDVLEPSLPGMLAEVLEASKPGVFIRKEFIRDQGIQEHWLRLVFTLGRPV
jgi:hypothetical protein